MTPIREWSSIAPQFTDTLLLGNGASISVDRCFAYGSLLDHAIHRGLITADVQKLFTHFGTTDFELVMRMLWHATHVNHALGVMELVTGPAYDSLQAALIAAVRETHVSFTDAEPHLLCIQDYMARFKTVLSLNYDLCVYWAMMAGNEDRGGSWFKDCWLDGSFDSNWRRFRDPIRTAATTLVFYPHGSLVLASHPSTGDAKLTVDSSPNLLDRVIQAWTTDDFLPLFVSEGDTRQKLAAISRHEYLTTVYNEVMTEIGPSVVVFGWGFGEHDAHILRRICGPGVLRLAVSVYTNGRSAEEIDVSCQEIKLIIRRANPRIDVVFFDSAGAGTWNVPV